MQQVLTIQAREAAAWAAFAAGDAAAVVREMDAAVTIEDAIDSLSQPPYPIIPAHEVYGWMPDGDGADPDRHERLAAQRFLESASR